jgi:hypothetical protein
MDTLLSWCNFCNQDVPDETYDYEIDMCHKCKARLVGQFKISDDKKPLGKIKSLKREE